MAEVFVNSGDSESLASAPAPALQGSFIPGIDIPDAQDGFGLVTPLGGGPTARRYGEYGVSAEVSAQNTQLNGLALGGLGGGLTYDLGGFAEQGPRGFPGPQGLPGITTVIGLPAYNSNFLTDLPYNLDSINDLGTAANKLLYTSAYTGYLTFTWFNSGHTIGAGSKNWDGVASDSDGSNLIIGETYIYISDDSGTTWTERRPAGAASKIWKAIASDDDGSHLIAGATPGRLYTSSDGGVNWTERQPAGATDVYWQSGASDGDGSNLIVCEAGAGLGGGRIWTSSDGGINWVERRPIDDNDYVWRKVVSDNDGSVLVATLNGSGDVYISVNSGGTWTARQPGGSSASWHGLASDSDGSNLIVAGYNGRLYTSSDYGVNWTEQQPAGDANKQWATVASDADGSHLVAGGYNTKLWVSGDSGATWVQQRPTVWTGIYTWWAVDLDNDGSNLIIAQNNGLLYTGILATTYQLATWAESAITSAGRALLDDATAAAQATTLGLGTTDSPTHVGLTLSGITAEGSDVDKFLVDSTGVIKYRTGAQVLSDIGAQVQSDALDSIAALGAIADNEFIVGTGAGTYAYEDAATAATSMGLGELTAWLDDVTLENGGAITTTQVATFAQLVLTPRAAALSAVEGAMFYDNDDNNVYVCTEGA